MQVTEKIFFTLNEYLKEVGSLLSLVLFIILGLFGVIGSVFVILFISQLKKLIKRKYKEAKYMQHIQKHLTKFRKIHSALSGGSDFNEYKPILDEINVFLHADWETMQFVDIEKYHMKMEGLDQKLPDIEDVENMLGALRFQQPEAQKMMEDKIDEVINKRAQFTLGKITELIQNRLSLFKLFMLYDDVELNHVKLKSELYVQNEKLEFLFKTLSERRSSKRPKK